MIKPLKAVYCYYYPEIREIIDEVAAHYPHETFLQSINPGLDNFHEPVIDSYIQHFKYELPVLGSFPNRYITGGASEGIFHTLSFIKAHRSDSPLYILKGEYEGYAGYGNNLGLQFTTVDQLSDLLSLPKGILFLSNPSARDGNIIPNQEILAVADTGQEIVYDITYVGMTDPHEFQLDHPNIIAVISSLSKPFGMYYYRVGFTFSRFEINTLMVNKWFKNIHSLIIAKKVLDQIDSKELVAKYRGLQKKAIQQMNKDLGTHAKPSQVVLLAYSDKTPDNKDLLVHNRQSNFRYCLTPYFLVEERGFV